jgi:hypothetical protein
MLLECERSLVAAARDANCAGSVLSVQEAKVLVQARSSRTASDLVARVLILPTSPHPATTDAGVLEVLGHVNDAAGTRSQLHTVVGDQPVHELSTNASRSFFRSVGLMALHRTQVRAQSGRPCWPVRLRATPGAWRAPH